MALTDLGSYTLGGVNIGLAAALGFLNPLIAQIDIALLGAFGLGGVLADIRAQFNAAIAAQASLAIQVSDPFAAVRAAIAAFAQLSAALQLALAFGLPTLSITFGAQLAAAAALAATLQVKIGGIQAIIAAGLAVKIPAIAFIGAVAGALNAGPLHLLVFDGSSLALTGAQIQSQFLAGLGPADPILPGEPVFGIILVTKEPLVFSAMGAILKTS